MTVLIVEGFARELRTLWGWDLEVDDAHVAAEFGGDARSVVLAMGDGGEEKG